MSPAIASGASRRLYHERRLRDIAARWDARAVTWDQELRDPNCHLNEDNGYARFLRCVRIEIRRRAAFCRQQGLIDVGCGTGLVMAALLRYFAWGTGVDISRSMVRLAQERRLATADFLVGDCFELPALCRPAGAVLSRGVLLSHYGPKHAIDLLRACRDALVPGGFLGLDFLNQEARSEHSHQPTEKAYFSAERIAQIADRAGLTAVKILGRSTRRALLLVAERA